MEIPNNTFGPMQVLRLYSAKAGPRAVVVVDHVALGPSIGGIRVSPKVRLEEVMRLI